MKVKRQKRASRILTFFKYQFKLEPPFNVLVDGTFCMAALSNQLNLREQLPKYLQGDVEIVTTKCVLNELEALGPAVYGGFVICRQYRLESCPHSPCRSASECLAHLARRATNGKTKYVMATQDNDLTEKLRSIIGTPILYIKYKSILLDKVSEATQAKVDAARDDIERVKEMKKSVFGEDEIKAKKKKKKGKNPLSCLKKKMKVDVAVKTSERTANGKRKRKKKKKNTEGESIEMSA